MRYVVFLLLGSLFVAGIVVEIRTQHHVAGNVASSDAAWQKQP
jgi:hypothetical protein